MHKMTIKLNIVIIVIIVVAFVCSMETYALHFQKESFLHQDTTKESPEGDTARKYNDKTVDATAQVTESNEDSKQSRESIATSPRLVPNLDHRTATVGDLPADHDPALVLRKGQTIRVVLTNSIDSEISKEGIRQFETVGNTYNDSGQIILIQKGVRIYCLFKIIEDEDVMRISITAIEMRLYQLRHVYIFFSNPSRIITDNNERSYYRYLVNHPDLSNKEAEEFLRLQEQLFLSPVMNAESILHGEFVDRSYLNKTIIFGEKASGGITVLVRAGYEIDLIVGKDILFSASYDERNEFRVRWSY